MNMTTKALTKELVTRAGTLKRLHYLIISIILVVVTRYIDAEPFVKGLTIGVSVTIIVLELYALKLAYNGVKQDGINSKQQE